ncbi:ras-domain-containing protein [Lophium mytilinum]|uniref:Ras-domain-containing protein n=1 Tax=Lophium mytilinum TaxID=390894 RepID=A0A6A6R9N3_9PEZI|nr:ras-domain-containing protein [Lophium mytilinum]
MDNPGPDSFPDTTARLPLLKAPLGKIDGTAPPGESIFVIEGDTFTVGALSLDDIPRIVAAEQAEIKRSNPHPSTAASGAAQVASPARDQTETPPTTAPSSLLPKHSRKLVVVGDGCAGKTMLLDFGGGITYNWDIHVSTVEVDGRAVEVSMWDTMGQEDYDRLRPLGYPGTHVVLIMFSLVNPDSLDNIQEKWISEILHFLPGVPYILVGNYKDVVNDPKEIEDLRKIGQHPVTREEAEDVCKKIEAKRYMEISAKTGEGLKELFEYATRLSLVGKPRKRRRGLKRLFGGA